MENVKSTSATSNYHSEVTGRNLGNVLNETSTVKENISNLIKDSNVIFIDNSFVVAVPTIYQDTVAFK